MCQSWVTPSFLTIATLFLSYMVIVCLRQDHPLSRSWLRKSPFSYVLNPSPERKRHSESPDTPRRMLDKQASSNIYILCKMGYQNVGSIAVSITTHLWLRRCALPPPLKTFGFF